MPAPAYPACVRELYESEIFGEAAALAVVNVARTDRDRYHLSTLLQLETETKARLRLLLVRHGMSLSEEMDLSSVPGVLEAYQSGSWQEFMAGIQPVVEGYLTRFKEIAEAAPDEDGEIARSMVRHENAILQWVQMEIAGDTERSLEAMIAELNFPVPKPAGV
jgi:hypothetical protein